MLMPSLKSLSAEDVEKLLRGIIIHVSRSLVPCTTELTLYGSVTVSADGEKTCCLAFQDHIAVNLAATCCDTESASCLSDKTTNGECTRSRVDSAEKSSVTEPSCDVCNCPADGDTPGVEAAMDYVCQSVETTESSDKIHYIDVLSAKPSASIKLYSNSQESDSEKQISSLARLSDSVVISNLDEDVVVGLNQNLSGTSNSSMPELSRADRLDAESSACRKLSVCESLPARPLLPVEIEVSPCSKTFSRCRAADVAVGLQGNENESVEDPVAVCHAVSKRRLDDDHPTAARHTNGCDLRPSKAETEKLVCSVDTECVGAKTIPSNLSADIASGLMDNYGNPLHDLLQNSLNGSATTRHSLPEPKTLKCTSRPRLFENNLCASFLPPKVSKRYKKLNSFAHVDFISTILNQNAFCQFSQLSDMLVPNSNLLHESELEFLSSVIQHPGSTCSAPGKEVLWPRRLSSYDQSDHSVDGLESFINTSSSALRPEHVPETNGEAFARNRPKKFSSPLIKPSRYLKQKARDSSKLMEFSQPAETSARNDRTSKIEIAKKMDELDGARNSANHSNVDHNPSRAGCSSDKCSPSLLNGSSSANLSSADCSLKSERNSSANTSTDYEMLGQEDSILHFSNEGDKDDSVSDTSILLTDSSDDDEVASASQRLMTGRSFYPSFKDGKRVVNGSLQIEGILQEKLEKFPHGVHKEDKVLTSLMDSGRRSLLERIGTEEGSECNVQSAAGFVSDPNLSMPPLFDDRMKKYQCPSCEASFTMSSNLQRHRKKAHSSTVVRRTLKSGNDVIIDESSVYSNHVQNRLAPSPCASTSSPSMSPTFPSSAAHSHPHAGSSSASLHVSPSLLSSPLSVAGLLSRSTAPRDAPLDALVHDSGAPMRDSGAPVRDYQQRSSRYRHVCSVCSTSFTFRTNLTRHAKKVHGFVPQDLMM